MKSSSIFLVSLVLLLLSLPWTTTARRYDEEADAPFDLPEGQDLDLLEFPLNLEYMEAEFFLYGAYGYGLDRAAPELVEGGPAPLGARKANLDPLLMDLIAQFAIQEVGHLKAIKSVVKGFRRPQLDLSPEAFAKTMNDAMNKTLSPPFDPYANSINYLLASYMIPYVGLTGYVGSLEKLESSHAKRMVAGLLGVESGQDAVIRALLYERKGMKVWPYSEYTVADFTNAMSHIRNVLGHAGIVDQGLTPSPSLHGHHHRGGILAGDHHFLSFSRTPEQILRVVYGSGDASVPGGFLPCGGNGRIARSLLQNTDPSCSHSDI